MEWFAHIISLLNIASNLLGQYAFFFVRLLPGWLSLLIISAVTGVIMLFIFKYTSNQKAIGRVRDDIKASLLALKLYKDSMAVTVRAQGRVFRGAFLLLAYSLVPMLVMIVPVSLLLSQLGLWYQQRPLAAGEEAILVLKLNSEDFDSWPNVVLENDPGYHTTVPQTRVESKYEYWWKIKLLQPGEQQLRFKVNDELVAKQVSVGEPFMRTSSTRPGQNWSDILLHPAERPFTKDSPVHSVTIEYPELESFSCGTNRWIITFFVASMAFALFFKPALKVRI